MTVDNLVDVKVKIITLRTALVRFVGASTEKDLAATERHVRNSSAPVDDKAVMINAIYALRDTMEYAA